MPVITLSNYIHGVSEYCHKLPDWNVQHLAIIQSGYTTRSKRDKHMNPWLLSCWKEEIWGSEGDGAVGGKTTAA